MDQKPVSTKVKLEIEIDQELWANYQEMMQYWISKGAEGHTLEANLVSFMKQHLLHWALHKAHEKYGSV